jgi:hypothetical protein
MYNVLSEKHLHHHQSIESVFCAVTHAPYVHESRVVGTISYIGPGPGIHRSGTPVYTALSAR